MVGAIELFDKIKKICDSGESECRDCPFRVFCVKVLCEFTTDDVLKMIDKVQKYEVEQDGKTE